MPVFEAFRKKHPVSSCREVQDASFEKYRGVLPEQILQLWKEEGWCSYNRGLMCFINPDDYSGILEEWLLQPDRSIVFARNGFGELYTWNGEAIYQLFIHTGMYGRLMKNIDLFMSTIMVDDEALEDSHYLSIFNEATAKLGELAYDECFTFVPALSLGGDATIEHVRKVKHAEQLLLLAQVHGKLEYP